MGKWIGRLIAETGCAEIPDSSSHSNESIYVEPELYRSVMDRAKEVFRDTVKMKDEGLLQTPVTLPIHEIIHEEKVLTQVSFGVWPDA